ncbi:MAG TPA: 2-amino-4-hydroxy-6-hydroxymethyldihydropteridine diphosphokinase [Longimicrobiales bacterium]|nr:2-amino-4-hydroxy-6-hydroxymethyldihydropteridine diphosphokinase [Longimicrobiales bacterium]
MSPRPFAEEEAEEVLLALGSNLGDRLAHLRAGVRGLMQSVKLDAISPVVESRPQGVADADEQDDYLNAVLRGWTVLAPRPLLDACLAVERGEGRTRGRPGAPRTLDVDILFYGSRVVDRPGLRIPHRRWAERAFVLLPLRAVAAEWRDPESGRSVEEVCRERLDRLAPVRIAHPASALDPRGAGAASAHSREPS